MTVSTARKHTATPASATDIRKALKITKADISVVKKAFSRLGYSKPSSKSGAPKVARKAR